ncbi:MAG: hypothetical protein QM762_01375 [Chryseolinea sp.]
MIPTIQTEPFKKLLYLWPEKAIRLLFDNYYDTLTYIAQRHTRDIHAAEEIVRYTLAELWFRHHEKRIDKSQSIQHYLVETVKRRARKAYAHRVLRYKRFNLEAELLIDNVTDDEDVRLIVENPPMRYDKFDFDQSIFYCWRGIEYIFYPWLHFRIQFFKLVTWVFILSVIIAFIGCICFLTLT